MYSGGDEEDLRRDILRGVQAAMRSDTFSQQNFLLELKPIREKALRDYWNKQLSPEQGKTSSELASCSSTQGLPSASDGMGPDASLNSAPNTDSLDTADRKDSGLNAAVCAGFWESIESGLWDWVDERLGRSN